MTTFETCNIKSPGYLTYDKAVMNLRIRVIVKPNWLERLLLKFIGIKFIEEEKVFSLLGSKEANQSIHPNLTFEE